jgi:hypothetical protein
VARRQLLFDTLRLGIDDFACVVVSFNHYQTGGFNHEKMRLAHFFLLIY